MESYHARLERLGCHQGSLCSLVSQASLSVVRCRVPFIVPRASDGSLSFNCTSFRSICSVYRVLRSQAAAGTHSLQSRSCCQVRVRLPFRLSFSVSRRPCPVNPDIYARLNRFSAIRSSDPLRSQGFLCLWNTKNPSVPQKILSE